MSDVPGSRCAYAAQRVPGSERPIHAREFVVRGTIERCQAPVARIRATGARHRSLPVLGSEREAFSHCGLRCERSPSSSPPIRSIPSHRERESHLARGNRAREEQSRPARHRRARQPASFRHPDPVRLGLRARVQPGTREPFDRRITRRREHFRRLRQIDHDRGALRSLEVARLDRVGAAEPARHDRRVGIRDETFGSRVDHAGRLEGKGAVVDARRQLRAGRRRARGVLPHHAQRRRGWVGCERQPLAHAARPRPARIARARSSADEADVGHDAVFVDFAGTWKGMGGTDSRSTGVSRRVCSRSQTARPSSR